MKERALGRAGLNLWAELPGRLPLLGQRLRTMGGPGCKKKLARAISIVESRDCSVRMALQKP